jgi:glycosyltransferase involved in cell wall biosynthesis
MKASLRTWKLLCGFVVIAVIFLLFYFHEAPEPFHEGIPFSSQNSPWEVWVITPCYKQEDTVLDTIQSVLDQKFQNWNLLVVDDGSPEKKCFHTTQQRFRKLNIPQSKGKGIYQDNAGLSLTRLNGVKYLQRQFPNYNSSRVLLCFLDADDLITPKYLQNAVEHLHQVPDTELIYAQQLVRLSKNSPGKKRQWIWDVPELNVENAIRNGPLPVMSLIRLDLYERLGGFPAAMVEGNEDYSFWLKCLENGVKAHRLPMIGSEYLVKTDSMARSSSYKAVALPMVKASHAGLFCNWNLANSLNQLFCGLELRQVNRLLPVIELEPKNCNPVLWVWFYYIKVNGHQSLQARDFQSKLENCLTNNASSVAVPVSDWSVESSNAVPRIIFEAFNKSQIDFTANFCKNSQQSYFEDILDSEDFRLNLFRTTSLFGSFVSQAKSRSLSSAFERPLTFLLISTKENKANDILLRYASRILSLKIYKIIVSEEDTLDTMISKIDSRLDEIPDIDTLYLNLQGKEQAIISLLKSKTLLKWIGFLVIDFNKTALDLHGPLPAVEYVARSFGDMGVTTVTSDRGIRFMHDGLVSSYLSNNHPFKLLMRSTTYFSSQSEHQQAGLVLASKKKTIPNIVHFVFGMSKDENDRFFNMQQYLAVKAARDFLQPDKIYIHFAFEPLGSWWILAKEKLSITSNKVRDVVNIFNNPVHHFAHKADIIRLEALMNYGGIYLDLDVWVYRDIRFLLDSGHEFIMGQEGENGAVGLCNAIILAQKDSEFLKIWYNCYKKFSEKNWNEFSVLLPNKLATEHPSWIHILPHTTFFWPMWDANGLTRLYLSHDCPWFQTGYAVHLWSSKARSMIDELGKQSLYEYDNCFFRLARKIYYGSEGGSDCGCGHPPSLKGSSLAGETAVAASSNRPVKGVEMNEIAVGVVVSSLSALETARSSWMTAAIEFGMKCFFFTSSDSLAEEYAALMKKRKSKTALVPLIVLKPDPASGLLSTTTTDDSREWIASHMFAHMFDSNNKTDTETESVESITSGGISGVKWFVKVEEDTLLRPETLRRTLSRYDPLKPTYLGTLAEFHGSVPQRNSKETEYIRLRYALRHFYAISGSALTKIRPELLRCPSELLWEEDKAMALCLRKFIDLQPIDVSSSYYPSPADHNQLSSSKDHFHQIAYHHMDEEAQIDLARYLYGSHSLSVPALADGGHNGLNTNLVRPLSYLGDPNDFRHHDLLYSQGAVLSLWQEQCFASGEICGWKSITRSDCLAIGCCYKEEFPLSPCMKAEGGTFASETRITAAVAAGEHIGEASFIGTTVCTKTFTPPLVIAVVSETVQSRLLKKSATKGGIPPTHLLSYIVQLFVDRTLYNNLCDERLAKCISFQTNNADEDEDDRCTELIVVKDQKCLESLAAEPVAVCSDGNTLEKITTQLIDFMSRWLKVDASSLRFLSTLSLANKIDFSFLDNKNYLISSNRNEFQISCVQYNPFRSEPGLRVCTVIDSDDSTSNQTMQMPAPIRFQHQLPAFTVLFPGGDCIRSTYNQSELCYLSDGQLVGRRTKETTVFWTFSSETGTSKPGKCLLQYDGNLVCFDASGAVLWRTNHSISRKDILRRGSPFQLVVRDDRWIGVVDKFGKELHVISSPNSITTSSSESNKAVDSNSNSAIEERGPGKLNAGNNKRNQRKKKKNKKVDDASE